MADYEWCLNLKFFGQKKQQLTSQTDPLLNYV